MTTYNQETSNFNQEYDNLSYANQSMFSLEQIDKIEDLLALSDPLEMDNKIYRNANIISKILRIFYKKLCDNFQISREETDLLIYCLKFIDTLNLFMNNQTIDSLTKVVYDINELVAMINTLDSKDIILKKIRYMEMTVIYYRKKYFRNLFFTDGFALAREIEANLDNVTLNSGFDQKLFKQMQNVFFVTQGKIEGSKRREIQDRLNEMKALSLTNKKSRYNYYEDYDDYADYKNYSHTDSNNYQDYYDNFNHDMTSDYGNNTNNNYYAQGQGVNKNQAQNSYNYTGNSNTPNAYGYSNTFSGYNSGGGYTSGNYYSDYSGKNSNNRERDIINSNKEPNNEHYFQNYKDNFKGKNKPSYYNANNSSKKSHEYYAINNNNNNYAKPVENGNTSNIPQEEESIKNKPNDVEVVISAVVSSTNNNPKTGNNPITTNNPQNQAYYQQRYSNQKQNQNQYYQNNSTGYNNYNSNSGYYNNKQHGYYYEKNNTNNITSNAQYILEPVKSREEPVSNTVNSNTITNTNNNVQYSNQTDTVTPVKKNKQKNKKKRTMSTEENITKSSLEKNIAGNVNSDTRSKSKKTSSLYTKKNKNTFEKEVILEETTVSESKAKAENKQHTETSNTNTNTANNTNYNNQLQIEPYEVISVQVSKPNNAYNPNNTYNNPNYKNPNYKYNKNTYNNPTGATAYNSYNQNQNYVYNTKGGKNQKNPAYGYNNNYKYGNNITGGNNNYQNFGYFSNTQGANMKHEFVTLDDMSNNTNNNKIDTQVKEETNVTPNITPVVEVKVEEKPTEKKEEIKRIESPLEREDSATSATRALVGLDVEKMFQMNDQESVQPKTTEVDRNNDDYNEIVDVDDSGSNEEDNDQAESIEDEEVQAAIDDLINDGEEEDEEDSDDENELINTEFDKFIRESNMIAMTKNYNEDNYYVDMEENTKNNKIIFEDDNVAVADTNNKVEVDNKEKVEIPVVNKENTGNHAGNTENQVINNESTPQKSSENTDKEECEMKESTRGYMESLKTIDPKVLLEIKNKLNENNNPNSEHTLNNMNNMNNLGSMGNLPTPNSNNPTNPDENNANHQNMMPNFYYNQRNYGLMNAKVPLQNYIFSNYAHFFYRGRDSNIHREYFALKCLEQENSSIITKNIDSFENKILIPIYQRINFNVNKKKGVYFYTFTKYKKLIYRVLGKDKILKKVKPYGSYMNNFLIDSGDIDICIVPKCGILEFSTYLEKIKEEVMSQNIAEHKLTHHNSRYMLLKFVDSQTKFVVDITVHNMLPILNTNLIRLYSLYDQRFHILGLYIKHWVKINKIHGAADNFLSSYALLLMLIHFLQNVAEPRVLPNLQKIEKKEVNYEYAYNADTVKTNIYYEEDIQKIRSYMHLINGGKVNKDSASQLLVKFFEYYSYYYDYYEQKVSIHRDPQECFKKTPDSIAFSIEDPFDPNHNPGKSMAINSNQFNKFITSMKKEINFILNGEYVKRLEKVGGSA